MNPSLKPILERILGDTGCKNDTVVYTDNEYESHDARVELLHRGRKVIVTRIIFETVGEASVILNYPDLRNDWIVEVFSLADPECIPKVTKRYLELVEKAKMRETK